MAVPHVGRFVNEAFLYARQLRLSWYMFFFQLRGIADRTIEKNQYAFIRKLWHDWCPGWTPPEDEITAVIEALSEPGVVKAALAYYREIFRPKNLPVTPAKRDANRFTVSVPTLALTGENDHCIDPGIFQKLMHAEDFPRMLKVEQIPNAGHFLHQEQPDAVNQLLIDWLKQHDEGEKLK